MPAVFPGPSLVVQPLTVAFLLQCQLTGNRGNCTPHSVSIGNGETVVDELNNLAEERDRPSLHQITRK